MGLSVTKRTEATHHLVQDKVARITGGFYLAYILASVLVFLVTAWGLYVLLRPVNKDLALLFLLLNAVGVAICCRSRLLMMAASPCVMTF